MSYPKPDYCRFCCLGVVKPDPKGGPPRPDGIGFVGDNWTLPEPVDFSRLRAVVVREIPNRDETNEGTPLAGDSGYAYWKRFYEKSGWQRDELAFSFITRCYRYNYQTGEPGLTGAVAKDAYKKCRTYDSLVDRFRPDVAVISQDPYDTIKTPAFYRPILADLQKARYLADKGFRPLILMGSVPTAHYFKELKGFKPWQGSWFPL